MARSVKADVTPSVLSWGRERSGLKVEEAARKINVKPEKVIAWESGEDKPTIKQLRTIARVYRRPVSFFYLSEPPRDFQPMIQDYRRLPGRVAGIRSPELTYQIRRAQERREIALELHDSAFEQVPRFELRATQDEDPEDVGRRIRESLGVRFEEQTTWREVYDPFNNWRAAIERAGALVFQASRVSISEMRGFSIAEDMLPAIVVNTKDMPNGRVFTMLHEFCHVALRRSGICDEDEESVRPPEEQQVEVFCNRVAGAALVPQDLLLSDDVVREKGRSESWSEGELRGIARRFGVSREVVLRRLLIAGRATPDFYQSMRDQFRTESAAWAESSSDGGPTPDRTAVSAAGKAFVRLVLQSYYQERITPSDLADYLGVRLKHLASIEEAVRGL